MPQHRAPESRNRQDRRRSRERTHSRHTSRAGEESRQRPRVQRLLKPPDSKPDASLWSRGMRNIPHLSRQNRMCRHLSGQLKVNPTPQRTLHLSKCQKIKKPPVKGGFSFSCLMELTGFEPVTF